MFGGCGFGCDLGFLLSRWGWYNIMFGLVTFVLCVLELGGFWVCGFLGLCGFWVLCGFGDCVGFEACGFEFFVLWVFGICVVLGF